MADATAAPDDIAAIVVVDEDDDSSEVGIRAGSVEEGFILVPDPEMNGAGGTLRLAALAARERPIRPKKFPFVSFPRDCSSCWQPRRSEVGLLARPTTC